MDKHIRILKIMEDLKELDDDKLQIVQKAVDSCYVVQKLKSIPIDSEFLKQIN
ncbi:hypothetical protein [Paraclostridium tenue]|uniref:Uncharacterized protein n=1 Tax=Paraclostridium tenue TaxID=1737 RepID=A0ABN1M9I9_9FIRM